MSKPNLVAANAAWNSPVLMAPASPAAVARQPSLMQGTPTARPQHKAGPAHTP